MAVTPSTGTAGDEDVALSARSSMQDLYTGIFIYIVRPRIIRPVSNLPGYPPEVITMQALADGFQAHASG